MERKAQRYFLWVALLVLGTIWILASHNRTTPYQTADGMIFGTYYHITYQCDSDLKAEIDKELKRFDGSLSPFNDTATITRVNRNEDITPDTLFTNVFRRSMEISKETDGAFDITIAPLANAWGFGFKKGTFPDSVMIDSLLEITGYSKVTLSEEGKVRKSDERIMLSCSAIAKGYAVDIISRLLAKKGIRNFMVDIGGEVVVRGENPKKDLWHIGINKPVDDTTPASQVLQTVLNVTDVGIATSGNYRNFYYKDGKKYAHTIDPRTGYPVQHSILSATVIAKDCMSADAYATAFMVMGLEEAERFADAHPDINAYFIYTDKKGDLQMYYTKGMKRFVASK
ncbi:FAD:protein FMN transferase [Bacteroides sp. UBA939]|uniref:FAD:protein FMN transferase n=1 Tax=Bacteroides sp. UBA939 TaxID=1946092 RepID=UPI0025C6708E|nr:FAD:protein FMN transferase [Bacteroides sp. UBA939]